MHPHTIEESEMNTTNGAGNLSAGKDETLAPEPRELTFGQELVRVDFNPGGNPLVHDIKMRHAELIDYVHLMRELNPRHESLAVTALETACGWAVKLATTPAKS